MMVAAFAKAIIRNEFEPGALDIALTQAHAAVFTAWIAVFVTQPTLIYLRRLDLHRKLGFIAIGLMVAMATLSIWSTIRIFSLGMERFFFADPHVEVIVFMALAIPALIWRRDMELHKRLMMMATISLIGAGTAHLPFLGRLSPYAFLVVQDAFVVAGMIHDYSTRRSVHWSYWAGGALLVISQALTSQPLLGRMGTP